MRYSENILKQASNILDLWVISEEIEQDECEIKMKRLGIELNDIYDMMDRVNTIGIKDVFAELQEWSSDYISDYDDDFIDHYVENVQNR